MLALTRAEDPDRRLFASAGRKMTERQDRRPKARLRFARLRHQPIIEDVEYRAPRDLDRTLFQKLAQGAPTMGAFALSIGKTHGPLLSRLLPKSL